MIGAQLIVSRQTPIHSPEVNPTIVRTPECTQNKIEHLQLLSPRCWSYSGKIMTPAPPPLTSLAALVTPIFNVYLTARLKGISIFFIGKCWPEHLVNVHVFRVRSTYYLKLRHLCLKMSVPWVIYARTFYHKIGKAAHFWTPTVLFFTKFHKQISLISNGAPIQGGWPTDPISTEMITPPCGLIMPCLFSVISL